MLKLETPENFFVQMSDVLRNFSINKVSQYIVIVKELWIRIFFAHSLNTRCFSLRRLRGSFDSHILCSFFSVLYFSNVCNYLIHFGKFQQICEKFHLLHCFEYYLKVLQSNITVKLFSFVSPFISNKIFCLLLLPIEFQWCLINNSQVIVFKY